MLAICQEVCYNKVGMMKGGETMGIYITVLAFIGFDILTGFLKAFYKEGINSTALRKGLFHKLSEIVAVGGAALVEFGMAYFNTTIEIPMVGAVSTYICVMELISILENLSDVNPALAKLFKPYLEKLKDKGDENE